MEQTRATRYFVLKCNNYENLQKGVEESIWATPLRKNPPQPHEQLFSAFSEGPVILVFSVNGSKSWHGYAELMTPPTSLSSFSFTGLANDVDVKSRLSPVFPIQ
eukprot:TRINITY_DN15546_c0_g1_i1.p1 TRINITY_DN15546_c0_g1~~TRINITY_DN15546_c0_g1_i1.p1  ORF type:complete len:104 (+),score=5.96 TRINITY_DN15546_c0_g1_i1:66-377(+)